jgi:hypothetical protein
MREHPKVVGDKTTLAVMAALYQAGYALYTPFGENTRADLIIERKGELLRVQIKSGRLRQGTVQFACCSTYGHHPSPALVRRSYHGEIDVFGVHCRETGAVYLIPIEDLDNSTSVWLRVDPPKNNQQDRIRWAADYEIGRVSIEGLRVPSGG